MKILITGASRGIGQALAEGLARPGRTLHLVARNAFSLAQTIEAVQKRGADVHAHGVDLEAGIGDLGELDVDMLINNAGVSGTEKDPWEITEGEWRRTFDINVVAPFLLTSAFIRRRGERGGYVVDLSSGSAVTDSPVSADYWASKTALMRLAGSFHLAGRERGIKIFSVAPGVVATDMTAGMAMHDGRTDWTDVSKVVEIINAISDGKLDHLAGTYLRAGTDTVSDLALIPGDVSEYSRKLRLTPWKNPDTTFP